MQLTNKKKKIIIFTIALGKYDNFITSSPLLYTNKLKKNYLFLEFIDFRKYSLRLKVLRREKGAKDK